MDLLDHFLIPKLAKDFKTSFTLIKKNGDLPHFSQKFAEFPNKQFTSL